MPVTQLPEQVVKGAMQHMNADHTHNLLDYARRLAGCDWAETAVLTHLTMTQFVLQVEGNGRFETHTIQFANPVTDAISLRQALVSLAQQTNSDVVKQTATAHVPTAKAERYSKALVNHFARKVTASYEGKNGRIQFPFGDCDLTATDDALQIRVAAESDTMLDRTKSVVADHLIRFANKEEVTVTWEAPASD